MPRKPDEPVRLTKIYTRGGDAGQTSLGDGTRVSKLDPRVVAGGEVDELNSLVGWARVAAEGEIGEVLTRVENELFDLGADITVPQGEAGLRVTQQQIDRLEADCDRFNEALPELKSFVLPGGTELAARLFVTRAVCRRAERAVLAAEASPLVCVYLNRLSDLLFILARAANAAAGHAGNALEAWEVALVFAGSFVAGYLGSMLGLVLGTLRLPLVLLVSGDASTAAGTNIAISAASAATGGIQHARAGRVDWRVVAWMTPPSWLAPSSAASTATRCPSGCSLPRSPRSSSGTASTCSHGRFTRSHASYRGSSRPPRSAGSSDCSAERSVSSSARCACRRSCAAWA